MSIHDDAEAARRKVYDDALSERDGRISALIAREAELTAQLESAGADADAMRATIRELRARIEDLTAPAVEPSPGLPFKVDAGELAKSPRKWLDHYFPVYADTMDNVDPKGPDQYNRSWLPVAGAGASVAATGGYFRDRPLSDAPYTGDWRRKAAANEIRYAQKYLRDGFFVDLMSTAHSTIYSALRDVANANFPGFLVVPMVDTGGSLAKNGGQTLVDVVASFLTTTNTWTLPDGSTVVASYAAQNFDAAWWAKLASDLKAKTGKTVSFVHVYNNYSASNVSARPAYASGQWSPGADPSVLKNQGDIAGEVRRAGQKYLAASQVQNVRPGTAYGPWFDESANTESLRVGGARLIKDQADIVQGVTWNDWTEGAGFAPSVMHGTVPLEMSAAIIYEWKTGRKPEYLVDYAVVSHRNQTLDAKITGGQTTYMTQKTRGNMTPVRNKVEVYAQLTKPGKVVVTVGGLSTSFDGVKGENVFTVEAKPGAVSVTIDGRVALTSPIAIRSASGNQDRSYAMVSTLGPTNRQYDPTPAA